MSELLASADYRPSLPPVSVSSTTTAENRTGSWKRIQPVYRDRVAPCNEGCPAGVDVEGYMSLLADGKIDEACALLLSEHPMPAVTGRVCDHPCEARCNRSSFDGAVAIHAVERALGDRILAAQPPAPPPRLHPEKVAVVGSGPAGLACAYHLARLGYSVRVFERDREPGGMLRSGIPSYRLPRAVLDRQIDRLKGMGIRIHCDTPIGDRIGLADLATRYAAVFVATGAHRGRPLGIQGEELPGVRQGLEFLEAVNRGERPDLGRRVAVVGGGNTAIDCARTALRLGAEPTILYRRTRAEMPAIFDEVAEAEAEGIHLVFLASPAAFVSEGGRLTGIVCTRMRLGEPDASGRRRPEPSGEEPFTLPVDTVLTATGEDAELVPAPTLLQVRDGVLVTDAWGMTGMEGVFAGGDATATPRSVAWALGSGKRAALGIDRYLRSRRGYAVPFDSPEPLRVGPNGPLSAARWRGDDPIRRVAPTNEVVGFEELNLSQFARVARSPDRRRHSNGQLSGFLEVNVGLASDSALAEAGRCFNCGVCNGCEVCRIFCGDMAILPEGNGARFRIDLDHCKGCGVCAEECPRGAITMTREGL